MPRSSKLARRMKLKKKIEEEFRVAEERRNVGRVPIYKEYWDRADVRVGREEGGKGAEKMQELKKRKKRKRKYIIQQIERMSV